MHYGWIWTPDTALMLAYTELCFNLALVCSLSVLHYRFNAACPVPAAVGSFTASLPCASYHLPWASNSQ